MWKRTVLVVDSERRTFNLVSQLLDAESFEVRAVEDAGAALKDAGEHPPALVVLSCSVPGAFQGCRSMRDDARLDAVPLLWITDPSMDAPTAALRAAEAAADYLCDKPLQLSELAATLSRALEAGRHGNGRGVRDDDPADEPPPLPGAAIPAPAFPSPDAPAGVPSAGDSLEARLAAALEDNRRLAAEADALRRVDFSLRRELDEAREGHAEALETLRHELGMALEDGEGLRDAIQVQHAQRARLEESCAALQAELDASRTREETLRADLDEALATARRLEGELLDAQREPTAPAPVDPGIPVAAPVAAPIGAVADEAGARRLDDLLRVMRNVQLCLVELEQGRQVVAAVRKQIDQSRENVNALTRAWSRLALAVRDLPPEQQKTAVALNVLAFLDDCRAPIRDALASVEVADRASKSQTRLLDRLFEVLTARGDGPAGKGGGE